MKKIYLVMWMCLLVFLFSGVPSYAFFFDVSKSIPGLGCGLAGSDEDRDRCCKPPTSPWPDIPAKEIMQGIPIIGDNFVKPYQEKKEAFDKFQKEYSQEPCVYGEAVGSGDSCVCTATASSSAVPRFHDMCNTYLKSGSTQSSLAEEKACHSCIDGGGFYSGLGCIPLTMGGMVNFVFGWGVGLAGGVAFMCILFAAFQMQTSQGKAETVKKAQEMMTACITGLVLIIFSVLILRIIGVDILRIPFFTQ